MSIRTAFTPFWAALLLLTLMVGPASAGSTDLDLLSGGGLPPNTVILLDNSGSMKHHVWDDDFDPEKLYANTCWAGSTMAGSSCPGLGNPGDECADSQPYVNFVDDDAPTLFLTCNDVTRTIYIDPDVSTTRYSINYLNFLFGTATPADLMNESQLTRNQAAKGVIKDVVDGVNPDLASGGYDENVRFGLAQFDLSRGGYLRVPIANGNKPTLMSQIDNIVPSTWTPLAEALVDIGRYYAGTNGLGNFPDYEFDTNGNVTASPPPSPIDNECRQNFAIVMTDGEPTQDRFPHYNPTYWDEIGNADGDGNECSTDFPDTCTDDPESGRDDGLSYKSAGTDWLDDVAYHLNDTDLHPGLDGTQNLITYSVGFLIDHPLLRETADNGNGLYFTTNQPDELADQLEEAILDIIDRSFSFTAASVPTGRTAFGDGFYSAFFFPSDTKPFWEGHLEAFRLRPDGQVEDRNGNLAVDSSTLLFKEDRVPYWDAGINLRTNTSRNLYTTLSDARADFDTANALLDPNTFALDAGQIPTYPNYPASGVDTLAELGDALIDYLHGKDAFDEDQDGDPTELRAEVLGDIFHSNPVVVARPPTFLLSEEGFGSTVSGTPFFDLYKERDRVIFAGGNDGMLHAFDAGQFHMGDNPDTTDVNENGYYDMGTGDERFGYIPGMLLDKIRYIPRNVPRAYSYVDGGPIIADAWLGDPNDDLIKDPAEWATVMIVGMREGGAGYLALDVTNPAAASAGDPHGPYPKYLWEFDSSDSSRLGEAWSDPVITRVKVRGATGIGDKCGRVDGDIDCREEWVAIFGAGYTDAGNPNTTAFDANSLPGKGIFVVSLRTGEILASVEYDPAGVTGPSSMRYAIGSSPAVLDSDFDGMADVVYVGDLGGQIWKWDLSNVGVNSGGDPRVDNWTAGLFFRAPNTDMGGGITHYKSIFFGPSATLINGTLVLAFGTGERADITYEGDAARDENNRFYVVKDPHPTGSGAFLTAYLETNLTDITGLDTDPDPTDSGFFFVARDGEKFVTEHTVFGGHVITASFLPDMDGEPTCGNFGGESFLYIFDVASGKGFFHEAGVVIGDAARRISVGDGAPTAPRVTVSLEGNQLYIKTSGGVLFQMDPPSPSYPPVEVIYWKQNF
jgi:type IV pilus assembly protein PilY1